MIDPLDINELKSLNPFRYDNVIILNKTEDDTEKVDSSAITILLQLRDIFKRHEAETGSEVKTQLISEVSDSENLELISKTGVNDSIISTQMVSKIISQVAENHEILTVYDELFEDEGSEIYLKPIDLYFEKVPAKMTFAELMLVAQKRKEVLIGFRRSKDKNNVKENFGISINPDKNWVIDIDPSDRLIVLAEDEL